MSKSIVYRVLFRLQLEIKTFFLNSAIINGIKLKIDRKKFSKKMKMRLHRGKFELPEYELIDKKVEGNERVLELGSGIGFISIALAKKLHPNSLFSYEVNPELVELIGDNQRENNVEFDVFEDFLTTDPALIGKSVPFYISEQFYSSSFEEFPDYQKVVQKRAKSLDDAIQEKEIDMLVMDIEGYEYRLLLNWTIPTQIRKFCLEIHPYKVKDSYDLTEYFKSQGFAVDESFKHQHVLFAQRL